MQLVNEFSVRADPDSTFATLARLEELVGCIPGAVFEGRDGDDYRGRVQIRIGPVVMNFASTATVLECDEIGRRLVVRGQAQDRRGQGSASALVTLTVADGASDDSDVRVETDLDLSGRVAQFGGAAISHVNRRIMGQFVAGLNDMLVARGVVVAQAGGTATGEQPVSGVPWIHPDQDLPILRRLAPPASVVLSGALLGIVIARAIRQINVSAPTRHHRLDLNRSAAR